MYFKTQKSAFKTLSICLIFLTVVSCSKDDPGYAEEQISPDFRTAINLELNADGSINGDSNNQWSYEAPWLTMEFSNGFTDKLYVEWGRDWENSVDKTILFSGLNNERTAIWAK